ncbi:alpha-galactosidase [Paenibacillus sp. MWE-103]|uniref:Alpha-galactosidase n=1 Tax=Paenibacillus artemisiicola TaxID=1172618 RepID=A0ABS3W4D2_9BACL|nr:glycoside hydrolase family 36 protein [Paenibacillus artemisiicola]MBO7743169.1 alpha-galactosidase [Paenibacillus artemisiicola]
MQLRDQFQFNRLTLRIECFDRTLDCGSAHREEDAENGMQTWRWDDLAVTITSEDQIRSLKVQNTGVHDVHLRKVSLQWKPLPVSPYLDARNYVQLHHSPCFEQLAGVRPVHRPGDWSDPAEPSAMVTVLSRRRPGEAWLLGALPPYEDCFVSFPILHESAHRDGAFGISVQLTSPRRIAAKSEVALAHLILLHGIDGISLLDQYGEFIRYRLPRSLLSKPRITGWNSWDYYAGAVTQRDITRNTVAARERFADAMRYIVIDEGYQCQWGIWDAGWKFPDGLKTLCEAIREAGFEPGIWTAPLMVHGNTSLYRENPNWFVNDEAGNPYLVSLGYGSMAQLDITVPEVQEHLFTIYTQLRRAGFTYFKCDFTQMLLGASRFARDDITPAGMLRELFRLIRRAIGEDAYLLACGAPYEAVIGIADSHRTTGDIHHYWSHIRQNIRSMLARWWMQGTIGNTDPDFAIVRCGSTTDDIQLSRRLPKRPWHSGANWYAGREMNLAEAQTLLLACYVTGGDMVLGDALNHLNEAGVALLSTVLQELVGRGVPMNLFDYDGDDLPIVVAEGAGRKLLAIFNLSDDYRPKKLPHPFAGLKGSHEEFWTGQPVNRLEAGEIMMEPHTAKAWWVSES